ncbi:Gfo/Idh/MocA family protein [Deinococcus oregonensis]|uniref:Gfo/Idh/MocA family protein n=1 Tax=Deinococcus oregonensis TaxID=1805970 RepID=A0ABV6AXV8_9DEIO
MRVGLLSFAHVHAEQYQALLRAMPGVELVGFWDDSVNANGYAQRFALQRYLTPQQLLAQALDAIIICSETSRHREFVELSARAGVHILCEKPIALTLNEAEAMREICVKHGVTFMTAFPMRFDPSCSALRQAVQQGQLGGILGINGVNHSENPAVHRAWFADPALSGGGAVMDHVVHLADLLRWCFACEVAEVYAALQWTGGAGELTAPLDTAGLVLLTLTNGVQASIDCSWNRPATYPRWGHLKLDVVGTEGLMVIDAFAEHLTVYAPDVSHPVQWPGFGADPNQAMLSAFLEAVRCQEAPPVSWQDGYEATRVVLAAYASAQQGQPVRLSPSHSPSKLSTVEEGEERRS